MMNRSYYFNYIEQKLNTLSCRIKNRSKINLLDLNIYSETFFAELVNHLLAYNLKNINAVQQNTEGIDLIDDKNKIIAQVSSTCSVQKIESSLSKKIFKDYLGFSFKFILISGDADKLRGKVFKNPYNVIFSPSDDILDIKSLLKIALNLQITQQRMLYEFLKEELGDPIDIVKVDTNLASIINILSLAYILFADEEQLPCLHFLLNDKKELMHDNQLIKVAEFVQNKNIQLVISILKDKLPTTVLDKAHIAVELSQNNKLFKIEKS